MWMWHVLRLGSDVHSFYGIDLFDQNVDTTYAEVRLRCLLILLVLIYLIKMWVWHVLILGSDVHGYHWY